MARGGHPQRVPLFGAALTVAAFLSCWGVSSITVTWVAAAVYCAAAAAAGVGFALTLRDYS